MLSFTTAGSYDAAPNLSAIVAADFNNDGKLDLASAGGFSATRVGVRLGDGAGGFGAAQGYVFGWGYPTSIAAADFNNDSNLDIVLTDLSGCSILMGNGDGTFQSAVEPASGDGVHVSVGHFNNDSNIDLVVGGHHWDFGLYYQPYLGNGEGGFAAGAFEYIGGDPYNWNDRLAAVELNNDGKLDVVIGDGRVLLGNGNGTFQYEYGQPVPVRSGAIATGDFTGDGYADVIVSGSSIKVLRSRGDGGFDPPIQHFVSGGAVATANFNGDEKLDAVVTDGATGIRLLLGNGDGTLQYVDSFPTGSLPSGIAVGDFNGDSRPDMAVANQVSQTVSVLLNDGVWQVEPILTGDYNRDQTVDAADYVMWRDTQGTTVTPSTGADGSGNGVVDQDDYNVWHAHFGQTASPPAAGNGASAAAESNLSSLQVSDVKPAVEVRRVSENQRTTLARESAFVELAAPHTTSVAESRPNVRSLVSRIISNVAIWRDAAPLKLLSQPDSKNVTNKGYDGDKFDNEEANKAYGLVFDSVVDAIAFHLLVDA